MTNGSPATGTYGPAKTPFGLPQNLGGTWPYVTATVNNTDASVTLVVSNISGYSQFTIYRVQGSSRTAIRNAIGVQVSGVLDALFMDYEAPLGLSVTYVLNADDTDVATSNPVTLTYSSSTYWLKNVNNPSLSTKVEVSQMGDVVRSSGVLVKARVLGRPQPHIVTDVRSSRSGSMVLTSPDLTSQQALVNLFADGGLLFFQCPPEYGFPDLYFVPDDLTEKWLSVAGVVVHAFSFGYTEVLPPADQQNTSALNSYAQMLSFGTYQNVLNRRASYLTVVTTPWTEDDGS